MAKNLKKPVGAMCVFLFFSCLLLQSVSAEGSKRVPFWGEWRENTRSISSSVPISAFVDDRVLSIHSNTQRSDITIYISKDGVVLYEETIPALETDCVTIDLRDFELDIFSIELKNQWNDCLWGELILE